MRSVLCPATPSRLYHHSLAQYAWCRLLCFTITARINHHAGAEECLERFRRVIRARKPIPSDFEQRFPLLSCWVHNFIYIILVVVWCSLTLPIVVVFFSPGSLKVIPHSFRHVFSRAFTVDPFKDSSCTTPSGIALIGRGALTVLFNEVLSCFLRGCTTTIAFTSDTTGNSPSPIDAS